MKKIILIFSLILFISYLTQAQVTPRLGTAENYTVLAGTSVVNNGSTTKLDLNLGVSPGSTVTGILPAMVKGAQEINNANAALAQTDLGTAYNDAATGQTVTQNLSGQNLGGRTLTPGVYKFNNNATLTGTLTLNSDSNPNGVFIFQIDGDLTFSNSAAVQLLANAQPARSMNIYWQVAGSVIIGSSTNLRGTIMANQNITASPGNIIGRLLSKTGTVSLDNTIITLPTDLTVAVTMSPGVTNPSKYYIGEPVTYTVTARNNGPNNDATVTVENILHAGLTYVSAVVPGGTTFTAPTATTRGIWNISNFPKGTTLTLQVSTLINTQASANTTFYASIEGKVLDEITPNNQLVSFCVVPDNAGVISGPASVCVGTTGNVFSIAPVPGATEYVWNLPSGWSYTTGNGTSNTISVTAGTAGGQITVRAKNTCQESNVTSKVIGVNAIAPEAPAEIRSSNTSGDICLGAGPVTYTIDPVERADSYTWSVPAGWTKTGDTNGTSITVEATSNAVAGFIEVVAKNGCGNSPVTKIAVTPSIAPPTAPLNITGSNNPCIGDDFVYTANGATGATSYTWVVPTGWVIKGSATGSTITVTVGASSGSISATAKNACGSSSTSATLAVAPITKTKPGAITGPLSPCVDPAVEYTYSIDPVPGATSYFWRVIGGSGISITSTQVTTTTVKVRIQTGATPATLSVIAFNNCGQSDPQQITITPQNRPGMPLAITGDTPQPCVGKTNLTYSIVAVAGATSYSWTVPNTGGWQIIGSNTGTSITVTAGSTSGNISVSAVNACGPGSPRTLAVSPTAAVPSAPLAISGTNNPCVGNTNVSYSIGGVTGATGYTWEVPTGYTIMSGQNTTAIVVRVETNAIAGDIKVTANNNCGPSTATALAVTPSTTPSPAPGQITGSIAVPCVRQTNVTYSVRGVPGATSYSWSVTGDGWSIPPGSTGTSVTLTVGNGAGTLSVRAVNGCGSSEPSTLLVTPATTAPAAPLAITGDNAVCQSQTNLTYSVAPVAGANSYLWTLPTGWTLVSGQGTSSVIVNAGTQAGFISVQAVNNCEAGTARTLAVAVSSVPPGDPGDISGTTGICAGQSNLIFTVPAATNAISYFWTVPAGWNIVNGQNTPTITVTAGTIAGLIKVKAVNGCGESAEKELAVTPTSGDPVNINPIQAGSPTACANQERLVYFITPVAGAVSYNWEVPEGWTITDGQGTTLITVSSGSTSGNIVVTAANNCGTKSSSLMVTLGAKPATTLAIEGTAIPCAGSTGNIYRIAPVPGADTYTWVVPDGWTITSGQGTTSIAVAAGSGRGNISVTASNACGNTANTLAVAPASVAPVTPGPITGSKSVCSSAEILTYEVSAVENAARYIWTVPNGWDFVSGQGTNSIKVKASSNNDGTITVYAENGCDKSSVSILAVSITGLAPSKPGIINGLKQICAGEKDVIYTVGGVSGAASYTWAVPDGWAITAGQGTTSIKVTSGSEAGNITVAAVNGCGPSTESVLAVTTTTKPENPQDIAGEKNQCANTVGAVYSIAAVPGAKTYKWTVPDDWQITAGQGSTAITVTVGLKSGNIVVEASNDCGSSTGNLLIVTSLTPPSAAPGPIKATIEGLICTGQTDLSYAVDPINNAASYIWTVPADWVITTGQGTTSITVTAGTGAGDISVKAKNACGESNATTLAVSASQTASVKIADITGEETVCFGQRSLTYSVAAVSGATNYTWEVPAGWVITSGQGTPTITITANGQTGSISVVASNSCLASLPATKTVKVNPTPLAPAIIKDLSSPCAGLSYSVDLVDGATSYTWVLPAGWNITAGEGTNTIQVTAPAGSKTEQITVTANTSTCNSPSISLEADPGMGNAKLSIANVFSPNGDGVNEKWEITNIQNYKENEITIINRWGSEVYRRKGYQNDWDGGGLSPGTYFYVLKVKVCDGTYQSSKGYVMIMR